MFLNNNYCFWILLYKVEKSILGSWGFWCLGASGFLVTRCVRYIKYGSSKLRSKYCIPLLLYRELRKNNCVDIKFVELVKKQNCILSVWIYFHDGVVIVMLPWKPKQGGKISYGMLIVKEEKLGCHIS